jgi:flagellar assembly protein FliH
MPEIRPFELRSFDAEVQAQADLQKIRDEIQTALADRDRIRDEARREGLELGRLDAVEQASKVERERVAAEIAGLSDLLRKSAAGIDAKLDELVAAAERDLVRLALAVAAKIVKVEIVGGKPVAAGNLRRAVELSARRQEIKVLLHPDDVALIEAYLPDLQREFSDLQKVALEASPHLARGGVVVQTREGSVDAAIATQLEEIERGLLG